MPMYQTRDENEQIPINSTKMNSQGGKGVIDPFEEKPQIKVDMLGGKLTDEFLQAKKAHSEMITAVLKLKPRDVHILKKSAKYIQEGVPDEWTGIESFEKK